MEKGKSQDVGSLIEASNLTREERERVASAAISTAKAQLKIQQASLTVGFKSSAGSAASEMSLLEAMDHLKNAARAVSMALKARRAAQRKAARAAGKVAQRKPLTRKQIKDAIARGERSANELPKRFCPTFRRVSDLVLD